MARILVVENEWTCALTLKNEFVAADHEVEVASDGEAAVRRALTGSFDLMVLDIGLPKKNGREVCIELRRLGSRIPILMLTGQLTEAADKVTGLDLGADDYVLKPWETSELLARIRAILRRAERNEAEVYCFGDLEVDLTRRQVRLEGREVRLTPIEYELLSLLVRRQGQAQTRQTIYKDIGANSPESVDTHVSNLKKKILRGDANKPQPSIVALWGTGYRFDPPRS